MVAMRNYVPGGAVVIRFIFGFLIAASTLAYLVSFYVPIDILAAAETLGYFLILSVSMMFMRFGFSCLRFWTTDNDVKTHLVSQWDRAFGISGWLLLCLGVVSALGGNPERLMQNASVAVYGLFYSYVLKGLILTALYPNPDDDLYYVETNHTRHRKLENANEAVLH